MANRENIIKAVGNKLNTTLASSITSGALSITLTDATGFHASGGAIVIDYGVTGKEERIYYESRSGNVLTIATDGRGAFGTSAVAHDAGATVKDVLVDEHINGMRSKFLIEHDDNGGHTGLDDGIVMSGSAVSTSNKVADSSIITPGWINAGETWTYSSVDDPLGIFTISGDKTTKYSNGMRIKFTNGGNTIYGIIVDVAHAGGTTTIKFIHEIDPSDSLALVLMANSAITNPYFSTWKAPHGFPLEPSKWSVRVEDDGETKTSPTATTWVNVAGCQITIPIGVWNVRVKSEMLRARVTSTSAEFFEATLSTANNSESDDDWTIQINARDAGGSGEQRFGNPIYVRDMITRTSKATYYFNVFPSSSFSDLVVSKTILEATLVYL